MSTRIMLSLFFDIRAVLANQNFGSCKTRAVGFHNVELEGLS